MTVMPDRAAFDRITFDSKIMAGRACIRGLRIPVSVIVGQIAGGASAQQILADYPDLEAEDVQQALTYAAWLTQEELFLRDAGSLKLLIDMPLAARVAAQLRADGHDAVHLREQGLGRLTDEQIFSKAMTEERIIVTANLDFGAILARAGSKTVSVIVFRLANLQPDRVVTLLRKAAVADAAVDLNRGAVVLIEETRLRIRHLPLGS